MRKLTNIIKIIVSIGLLILILTRLEWNKLIYEVRSTNYLFLIPATLIYFIAILLSAYRWIAFLKLRGIYLSLPQALKYYLISIFAGNFLPSGGLDIIRAIYAGRGGRVSVALAVTFIDRLAGFYAILFYLILAAITLSMKAKVLLKLTIIGILLLLTLNLLLFTKQFYTWVNKIKRTRMTIPIIKFLNSIYEFRSEWPIIIKMLPVSILIQLFFSLVPIVMSPGLKVKIPFLESILLLPIINFVIMIPITISGLGLREGAFIILYGDLIGREKSLLLSLFYYLTTIILSLIGWVLFLLDKPEKDIKQSF
ncbi:MAG: lysylphosphatidylglycerol synthase transmembrane domain-containing protein [bacterium]|nr:lysylphosphatidylglycerol synthase transmembrane domain-containing protein [bacterium]